MDSKKINTKVKLLLAALDLFLRKGYSAVSVNQIVKTAGISKGGFYHHFASKEELLKDVIDTFFIGDYHRLIRDLKTISESTHDRLKRVFKHFTYTANYHEIPLSKEVEEYKYILLVTEAIGKFPAIAARFRITYDKLILTYVEMLNVGIANGELREDLDVRDAAIYIASLYEGLYTLWFMNPHLDISEESTKLTETAWDKIKK